MRSAKSSSWNISAISRQNAPFLRGGFSSAHARGEGASVMPRRARGGYGAPTRGTTTGGTSRRTSCVTARSWVGAGPNLKRSFRYRISGRGCRGDRGRERGPPSGVERRNRGSWPERGAIPPIVRGSRTSDLPGRRNGHGVARIPPSGTHVPARSFDSSNCSKSRAHHCWPTVHRCRVWKLRLGKTSVPRDNAGRPGRSGRACDGRDGYYCVRRARTGRGHGFAHFATRRDISRAYAGEDWTGRRMTRWERGGKLPARRRTRRRGAICHEGDAVMATRDYTNLST